MFTGDLQLWVKVIAHIDKARSQWTASMVLCTCNVGQISVKIEPFLDGYNESWAVTEIKQVLKGLDPR